MGIGMPGYCAIGMGKPWETGMGMGRFMGIGMGGMGWPWWIRCCWFCL